MSGRQPLFDWERTGALKSRRPRKHLESRFGSRFGKICGEKIVFANETKFCSRCETVARVDCGGNVCGICGDNLRLLNQIRSATRFYIASRSCGRGV
jgi:hypothetical protein